MAPLKMLLQRWPRSTSVWGAASVFGVVAALLPLPAILLGLASLLACAAPVFGLSAMVLAVTAQDAVRLPGGLSLTQIAVAVTAGAWALRLLADPGRPIAPGSLLARWICFLAALLLASAWSPYSPASGLKELWRWGAALLAWMIAAGDLRRPWQIAVLVGSLLGAALVNAVIGLAQFWTGDGPPTFRISEGLRFVRAYGLFGQPNSFAGYLNHAWPLALALAIGVSLELWRARSHVGVAASTAPQKFANRFRWAFAHQRAVRGSATATLERTSRRSTIWLALAALALWIGAAVLLAALGAAFSRGAWLGALLGLLVMLLAIGGWLRWLAVATLALAVLVIAPGGAQFLPAPLAVRLASIMGALTFFDPGSVVVTDANFAAVERMAQVWAGWRMWLAHPLLGVGPGNFSAAYPDVASAPWFASRGHAHNYLLHIAAEAGLLGLVTYLALIVGVCRQAAAALRHARGWLWWVAVGSCGIIAAVLGHGMFENLHVLHVTTHLAAVWGLTSTLASDHQASEQAEEQRHALSGHRRRWLHRQSPQ